MSGKIKIKVIGIIGTIASGKGTVAKYLEKKYGFKHIVLSDMLRHIAEIKHIKPTRKNLEKLQKRLRENNKTAIINHAIKKIKKENLKKVVLDGIRTPIQARISKEKLKAKLIFIDAPIELRFRRAKKRRRTGFPRTIEEFRKIDLKEKKIFNLWKTKKFADFEIDNSKGKRNLKIQINRVMKKLKF